MADAPLSLTDRVQNLLIRGLLGAMLLVPYRTRVPLMGWITARIAAPVLGWNRRIRANLAHVCPGMPAEDVRRLLREVPDNAGRTLIEIYSGAEFVAHIRDTALTGPGVDALDAARAGGRPVVLVTGHFGNYDVPRAVLSARGYRLGALYRPMRNSAFNAHYVEAMSAIATPVFPATRQGLAAMLKHLRGGNALGILIDVYAGAGARVTYFGQPAPTATSAAEWALKYDALVIPIYGIRQPNGLDFAIHVDAPVAAADPVTMTQALNDSLEAQTRRHMGQWFWIHRRWKPERQRTRAAASIAP